jgi:hypothetical protein
MLAARRSTALKWPVSWLRLRYSVLLTTQLLVFLVYPFWIDGPWGPAILGLFVSATVLSAAQSLEPADRRLGFLLAGSTTALVWIAIATDDPRPLLGMGVIGTGCVAFLSSRIFLHALQIERVSVEKVQGSLAVFLLLGLNWALVYAILEIFRPGSFALALTQAPPGSAPLTGTHLRAFSHLLFHSYMTLCATSYGNVAAVTAPALALSAFETLLGQIYQAILVGQLMGLHLAFHRGRQPQSPG